MFKLTLIHAITPADGKTMVRPACEMYRTLEQCTEQVLRREYKSGIPTWIQTITLSREHYAQVIQTFYNKLSPVDQVF